MKNAKKEKSADAIASTLDLKMKLVRTILLLIQDLRLRMQNSVI